MTLAGTRLDSRWTVLAVATVAGLVLASAGIALIFRASQDGSQAGPFKLDHTCTVDQGIMSISGTVVNNSKAAGRAEVAVEVLPPGSDTPVDSASIIVEVPAGESTAFDQMLADYNSIGRGLRVDDDHRCEVELLESRVERSET